MPTVQLSQLKAGDKLIQDVQTPIGGVLLQKGHIIMPRELDILRAFLVPAVVITEREGTGDEQVETESANEEIIEVMPAASFQKEYDRLFVLIKKVFSQYNTTLSIPFMEIRRQLESLISRIKEYDVLKFSPQINNNEDYMFHNIGNMKVDKTILHKPEQLTPSEAEEMKKHTVYGYHMLKAIPALNEGVKLAALQHHEKVDGSGYPLGLKEKKYIRTLESLRLQIFIMP